MSLKKQVKELKTEVTKKDEELTEAKKNVKNTRFFEMDQEMKMYKDELIRLRYLLEQAYSTTGETKESGRTHMAPLFNLSPFPYTHQTI